MSKIVPASLYCNKVFDGTHDTPKPSAFGYPLVTSKHITNGNLDLTSAYLVSEDDYNAINKRSMISQWDILFSMIGTVGEVYLEKNTDIKYAIKNIGVFSCDDERKAKWLYYYLKSPAAKTHIKRYLNGAVQKFLSLGALRDFPVLSYDKEAAKGINLVAVIDAKIELNNRINAELEAMAKTLYNYWFVQFDFPDANGKPYKTAGGKMLYNPTLKREMPEGWHVDVIGEISKTVLGGTPSTEVDEYWDNAEIPWLSSAETASFPVITSEQKVTQKGIEDSAANLLPKGTVVISIVRYIRPSILGIDAATNQSVVGIKECSKLKSSFIYPYFCSEVPRLMGLRTGAQQPHINKGVIDESLIVLPPDNILKRYYEIAEPIFNKVMILAFESHKLIELRDWLLPMLMNGQVTVQTIKD